MAEELYTEEDQLFLHRAQSTYSKIVEEMTKGGIPKDKEDRAFLLAALRGGETHVFAKAKIKNDKDANKANQQAATALIAQMLNAIPTGNQPVLERTQPLTLPEELSSITVVPGETDIGTQQLNYKDFMGED